MPTAATGFQEFWTRYPRRIGKLAAEKAYMKARKLAAADVILAGVDRYIAHKPTYADYAHPATWLTHGRWMDEYEDHRDADMDWSTECQRLHGRSCNGRSGHALQMQLDTERGRRRA